MQCPSWKIINDVAVGACVIQDSWLNSINRVLTNSTQFEDYQISYELTNKSTHLPTNPPNADLGHSSPKIVRVFGNPQIVLSS